MIGRKLSTAPGFAGFSSLPEIRAPGDWPGKSETAQFAELLESTTPVGKKLEFLSQEILRELNTLGSKAKDLQLVRDVLDMKSETEKLREQVQNVE